MSLEHPMSEVAVSYWPIRVYYEDTDCGGVVYHTAYLRFMERARSEWLRSRGYRQSDMRDELQTLFVVRRIHVGYRKPALLDDELSIETRVSPERRTVLLFQQRITRDTQEICAGHIEVACMNARTRRPRPIPDRIQAELADVR